MYRPFPDIDHCCLSTILHIYSWKQDTLLLHALLDPIYWHSITISHIHQKRHKTYGCWRFRKQRYWSCGLDHSSFIFLLTASTGIYRDPMDDQLLLCRYHHQFQFFVNTDLM